MGRVTGEPVTPGVWRLPLKTPTLPPFTHTNAYLIMADGAAALVDPGSPEAVPAVREALGDVRLEAIWLTHSHRDHCDGAEAIQQAFGNPPVLVHPTERSRLTLTGPVQTIEEGTPLRVGPIEVQPLFTPGHSPGHLSFYLPAQRTLLAGDVVAGEGSIWVGHPEGDMAHYLETLTRLLGLDLSLIAPGHGPVVTRPYERLKELRDHRLAREQQVLTTLEAGPKTLEDLLAAVYPGLAETLREPARRSLLAHLEKLQHERHVTRQGEDERGPYAVK